MTGHGYGGHGMRLARVFDGPGPGGLPTVRRPPVDPNERDKVLTYLESAVIVFSTPGGGYKPDVYDPGAPAGVPEKTYTDGTWVWPADVYFYLRKHQIPPEPDLIAHIRAQEYRVPEVDDTQRAAATALATGAPPSRPAAPPYPVSPPHATSPGFPAAVPPSYGRGGNVGGPPPGGPAPGYRPAGAPGYAPGGPAQPAKSGMSNGAIAAIVLGIAAAVMCVCCWVAQFAGALTLENF